MNTKNVKEQTALALVDKSKITDLVRHDLTADKQQRLIDASISVAVADMEAQLHDALDKQYEQRNRIKAQYEKIKTKFDKDIERQSKQLTQKLKAFVEREDKRVVGLLSKNFASSPTGNTSFFGRVSVSYREGEGCFRCNVGNIGFDVKYVSEFREELQRLDRLETKCAEAIAAINLELNRLPRYERQQRAKLAAMVLKSDEDGKVFLRAIKTQVKIPKLVKL